MSDHFRQCFSSLSPCLHPVTLWKWTRDKWLLTSVWKSYIRTEISSTVITTKMHLTFKHNVVVLKHNAFSVCFIVNVCTQCDLKFQAYFRTSSKSSLPAPVFLGKRHTVEFFHNQCRRKCKISNYKAMLLQDPIKTARLTSFKDWECALQQRDILAKSMAENQERLWQKKKKKCTHEEMLTKDPTKLIYIVPLKLCLRGICMKVEHQCLIEDEIK